jgi:ABC-2 type transport system permease protein
VLRISLVLLLILAVGGAVAAARLSGQTPTDKIGLVGARSIALEPAIRMQARAAGRGLRLRELASDRDASRAVRDGSVAVALVDGNRMVVKTSRTGPAIRVVQQAVAAQGVLERLRAAGLTRAQARSALTPIALPVDVLAPRPRNYDQNQVLVVAALLALFMVLVFSGQAVAQGVTEEKSSRVVELLLTTVSPRRLLAGKILGVGVLGLGLLLIPGVAALFAGRLAGGAGLPSAAPGAVALILLWFVLGYVFYSVAFAAVGALVSRQEDLTTAMLPVNAVLIAAFYLSIIVVSNSPDGTVARVAAFLPPLSPMVVPARMILGNMGAIGLVAAIALDLFATAGLILLAARIYEGAILRTGAPVKLRGLLASLSQQTQSAEAESRHLASTDAGLRVAAVSLLLGAVAVGLSHPIAITMIVLGLLLVALLQHRKRHRPKGAGR